MFAFVYILALFLAQVACALPIARRDFSGEATYYAAGLGACGGTNSDSDFIVALNAAQYSSAMCGKSITITANGKSAQATIVDLCPGCAYGDLDMTDSLFQVFNNLGVGRFAMSWSFNDGSGGGSGSGGDSNNQQASTSSTTAYTPPPAETSTTPAYVAPSTSDAPSSSSTSTSSSTSVSTTDTTSLPPTTASTLPSTTSGTQSATNTTSAPTAAATTAFAIANTTTTISPDTVAQAPASDADGSIAGLNNLVSQLGRLVIVAWS